MDKIVEKYKIPNFGLICLIILCFILMPILILIVSLYGFLLTKDVIG